MDQPNDDLLKLPLLVRAEMAMREAYFKVVEDCRQSGLPLVYWRDGRVVHLQPSPLPVEQWLEIENPNGPNHGQ